MSLLKVKLLRQNAKAPTVAHPGEDLGYDLYAAEDVAFAPRGGGIVLTGISVELIAADGAAMGALLRDKSSLASKRLIVTAGVIDAGYRGEIKVVMENLANEPAHIRAGEKIANMVPYPVLTGSVEITSELSVAARQSGGFGSSGRS